MSILEYFKLNEEPFRISPNPRFLFLNEQVKEASAKVSYMTKHRTAPLYMYGAIGSGKTSILRRLYEELSDDQTYNLRLLIAPNVKSSMAFLAQNMTRDILKLVHCLLNFETSDAKLLQLVLTGQEELSEKVKRYKELKSRMIPIAINSMSPTDLEAMLRFRWSVASGNSSEAPFSDQAYQEIFAYTKGLPRDAIKLADEVLRHLFISQKQTATGEQVAHAAAQLDIEK
jgi:general secretion pathway protein A